jgi:hypothetical protein
MSRGARIDAVQGLTLDRAGLGQMAETIGRDPLYQGHPGYEGMLNDVRARLLEPEQADHPYSESQLSPRS